MSRVRGRVAEPWHGFCYGSVGKEATSEERHMLERVVREEGRVFPRRGTMLREEVLGEGSTGLERTLPKQC